MKKVARTALRVGCALLLLAGVAQTPALADCIGSSVFFGNLTGATFFQLDLTDPAASWSAYMFERSTINSGTVPVSSVAFDLGGGTAVAFSDWGGGIGLVGCPLDLNAVPSDGTIDNDAAHQVSVFSDSRGSTVLVNGSIGNAFDYDTTFLDGGQLPVSTVKPRVLNAVTGASITLDLEWDPPQVLSDALSTSLGAQLVGSFSLFLRSSAGMTELTDLDGSTRDNRARVTFEQSSGTGNVIVQVNLAGAGGAPSGLSFRGVASTDILLTPGLATPGRGKGKGLEKAPGQNR